VPDLLLCDLVKIVGSMTAAASNTSTGWTVSGFLMAPVVLQCLIYHS